MTAQLRRLVAQTIRDRVPGLRVFDYPTTPTTNVRPGREVVTVYRSTFTHQGNGGMIDHALTVTLYGAGTGTAEAEDQLDAALDQVCVAILATGKAKLGTAERVEYQGKFQGWSIPITVQTVDYLTAELRHHTTTPATPAD